MKAIKIILNSLISIAAPGILLISKKSYIGLLFYAVFLLLQFLTGFTSFMASFYGLIAFLFIYAIIITSSIVIYLKTLNVKNNRTLYIVILTIALFANYCSTGLKDHFVVRSFRIATGTLTPIANKGELIIADCRKSSFNNLDHGNLILYHDGASRIKIRVVETAIKHGDTTESITIKDNGNFVNVKSNDYIGIGKYIYYSNNLFRIGKKI